VGTTLRVVGVAILVFVSSTAPAPAQDRVPAPRAEPAQDPSPRATPSRAASRRRYPIRDSVDRVVDAVVLAHLKPCDIAQRQGVPCFPVSVEQEGPRFSVAEALRRYRGTGSAAPGAPTVAEIQHQMPGVSQSASGGVGFDPACTAKNLVRKLSGRNTTFHLYRMWDERGERPLLTDRLLDPKAYAANLAVHYEYLGKFDGECAAVAAWRQALRRATEPKPLPDDWDEIEGDEPPE
jgi:hypothetical protein